jgi:hypothetical protein
MATIEKNTTSAIFKGMGSFWTTFFKDSDVLEGLYNATSSQLGEAYLRLMENFLNISLEDTPIYNRKDWDLLILDSTELAFDPAVYSWGSTNRINGILTFTSRYLGTEYDYNFIKVSDLKSLNTIDKTLYPTEGIYNRGFITGNPTHFKNWAYIVSNEGRVVDNVAALRRRVISSLPITSYVFTEDVQLTFSRYNAEKVVNITAAATAGNTDVSDLVIDIQAAIDLAGLTDVVVSTVGNYLIIEVEDDVLQLIDNNQAAEDQLFMKAFPFTAKETIPPGREDDFIWTQTTTITVKTDGYTPAGTEYRFPIDDDIKIVKFIYNSLFDPLMIMESNNEYRIGKFGSNNFIYFKSNPFEFDNVAFRDFGSNKQVALWLSEISLDKLNLWLNYGYQVDVFEESSQGYKDFLRGVYYYYTHGPQVTRVASALNIIAGIPVIATDDEIILSVSSSATGHTITTDQNTYVLPLKATPSVNPGDVMKAFDVMTDAFSVEDYRNTPNWFDNLLIPEELMPGAKDYLRVSLPAINIPDIGSPGYIIGDLDTSATEIVTAAVTGGGSNIYQLSLDATFDIEFDDDGIIFPIRIEAVDTSTNTSIEDLAVDIKKSLKQLRFQDVSGSGINEYVLGADATFDITYSGTTYSIIVTEAATLENTTLDDLIEDVNNSLISAGVTNVTAVKYSLNAITFAATYELDFSINNVNLTAQIELGLQTSSTPSNYTVVGNSDNTISIKSTTFGPEASVSITNISYIAQQELGLLNFVTGSGDFVGNDGDPSIGWRIMDEYLKYNLFRIRYDLQTVPSFRSIDDLTSIVLSGRPIYTYGITTPILNLDDTVHGDDTDVVDVDAFMAANQDDAVLSNKIINSKASVIMSYPEGQYHYYKGGPSKQYTENFPKKMFAYLLSSQVGADLKIEAKVHGQLLWQYHYIKVANLSNRTPEEVLIYPVVGIFNMGRVLGGVSVAQSTISGGDISGVYAGDTSFLTGENLAQIHLHANAFFVFDTNLGFDFNEVGIQTGNRLVLEGFSDPNNNGEFPILNILRKVPFKGKFVDMVWYDTGNTVTPENEDIGNLPGIATYGFDPGTFTSNKQWMVVVPDGETIENSINAALNATGNDEDEFPFNITLEVGVPTDPWVQTGEVATYTTDGFEPDLFRGDLYSLAPVQVFYIGDPNVFFGDGHIWGEPYGSDLYLNSFFIGNPAVDIHPSNWLIGIPEFTFFTNEEFKIYGELGGSPINDLFVESFGVDNSVNWDDPRLTIGGAGVLGTGDPGHPFNTFYINGPDTFSVIGGNSVGGTPVDGTYAEFFINIKAELYQEDEYSLDSDTSDSLSLQGEYSLYETYDTVVVPPLVIIDPAAEPIGQLGFYVTDGITEISADTLQVLPTLGLQNETYNIEETTYTFLIGDSVVIGQSGAIFGPGSGTDFYEMPLVINVIT